MKRAKHIIIIYIAAVLLAIGLQSGISAVLPGMPVIQSGVRDAAAGRMGLRACDAVLCMHSGISYAADDQHESSGSESSYADDQSEGGNYLRGLQLLGQAAAELAARMSDAAEEAIDPPITRREVYRIRPGARITRKELKRRGGAGRYFQIYKIREGDRVYKEIAGRSYKPGGAVSLSDLRYIRTLYYDFSGRIRSGEIIVNRSIAEDTRDVFRELYKAKYQIHKMRLIDNYFPSVKTSSASSSKAGRSDGRSGSGGTGKDAGKSGSVKAGTATGRSGNGKVKWEPAVWSATAAEAADTASMNDDNTSGFNYRMVAGTSSVSMHGYGRAIDVNPFENPWCPGGSVYPNQRQSASYANRGNVRDHMIYADSKITKIFRKHGFRWLGGTWTRDYQHFEK